MMKISTTFTLFLCALLPLSLWACPPQMPCDREIMEAVTSAGGSKKCAEVAIVCVHAAPIFQALGQAPGAECLLENKEEIAAFMGQKVDEYAGAGCAALLKRLHDDAMADIQEAKE